ncbi:hypothetical protein OPQ81_003510 [Rhizoctonia solani]|nr:hypothetical protein OPQ81_003510 [Rhizoctonia solani]
MSTKFDPEKAENLEEIEKQFAVKAVEHAQTYWQLLEAVSPKALKLTKIDDEIYDDFVEQFPEYKADPSMIETVNEDVLKSSDNKPRWYKFMNAYEKRVKDYTFGSLLRRNARDDYTEQNTMFVPRMQFYVFEIARNRLGMNDHCSICDLAISGPMRTFESVALFLVAASAACASPGILLIGDSTVTDGAGWGKGFCADTHGLARCTNLAVSGTTTTSWRGHSTEYQAMLTGCKTANTFATIQFGHNDQKVMTTDEFATNLEKLTNTIKSAGCSPILVTSLARRVFSGEHTTTDILGPYSNQTIAVANKLDLPILPLLADSLAYIQKLGKANSRKFNLDYNTTNKDTTHLNELGSLYFGRIVADEVKSKIPTLAPYIVSNVTLSAKIAAGTL